MPKKDKSLVVVFFIKVDMVSEMQARLNFLLHFFLFNFEWFKNAANKKLCLVFIKFKTEYERIAIY